MVGKRDIELYFQLRTSLKKVKNGVENVCYFFFLPANKKAKKNIMKY